MIMGADEDVTAYATGRATGDGHVVDVCVTYTVEHTKAKEAETKLKRAAGIVVTKAREAVAKAKAAGSRNHENTFEIKTIETQMNPQYDYDTRPPTIVNYMGTLYVCITATTSTAEMVLSHMTETHDDVDPPHRVYITPARLSKDQTEKLQALAVRDATAQAERKIAASVEALRSSSSSTGVQAGDKEKRSISAGRITNISIDYMPTDGGDTSAPFYVSSMRSGARAMAAPMAMSATAGDAGRGGDGGGGGLVSISFPKRVDVYAEVWLTRALYHSSS